MKAAAKKGPWLLEAHFKEAHEPWSYPHRYESLTGTPARSRGAWTVRGGLEAGGGVPSTIGSRRSAGVSC